MEETGFGGLRIEYDDSVLRPRPWTVRQSEWAAELIAGGPPGPLLELCAGVGHIGLLAIARQPRPLVCVDVSAQACDLARRNAKANGLDDLVEVRHGALEEALAPQERFALVIADPPWVRSDRTGDHPDDPVAAIDGGPDGLDVARECLAVARRHLVAGGSLLLQLGDRSQVETLAAETDLRLLEVRQEEGGVLVHLAPPR